MNSAHDTTGPEFDPGDFVFVEQATGGVEHRGKVTRFTEVEFAAGAQDGYVSYFRFTRELVNWVETHTNPAGKPTVAGFHGPVWATRFAADFDRDGDVEVARRDARALCDRFVEFGVPPGSVMVFYSGMKGFHIEIDGGWFGGFEAGTDLPDRTRSLAEALVDGLATADFSLYQRVRLLRAPHTVHGKSGRYKIPLTLDELRDLSVTAIERMADNDRSVPNRTAEPRAIPALVELWAKASAFKQGRKPWPGAEEAFDHDRNTILTRFAGAMRHRGMTEHELLAALSEINQGRCVPPLPDDEVAQIAHGVMRYEPGKAGWDCTDLGNANRLVALFGRDWRYDTERGRDFVWTGTAWQHDCSGAIHRSAHEVARMIREEAAAAKEAREAAKLNGWARQSEHCSRIDGMIKTARNLAGISIRTEDFDRSPFLLNLPNGALNLETGSLEPHRRDDLISKVAPIAFDPGATCPRWLAFLDRVMGGNAELVEYLRQMAGYALTGETREECFFFLYGDGQNGKSTFIETLAALLGPDYFKKTPTASLMRKKGERIPNDIARLVGTRLVVCSELYQGGQLDEALVKDLTGRDTISARFMRQEFFDFVPVFKLVMYGNHKPRIAGTDRGIWRRVRLVPFTESIAESEKDEHLRDKLRAELPGILNWAVAGCRAWLADGFAEPEIVRLATEEYREEMDLVAAFVAECCETGNSKKTLSSELYRSYQNWVRGQGQFALSNQEFGQELTKKAVTRLKSNGLVWRRGIALNERGLGFMHGPGGLFETDPFGFRESRSA